MSKKLKKWSMNGTWLFVKGGSSFSIEIAVVNSINLIFIRLFFVVGSDTRSKILDFTFFFVF